MSSQVAEPGEPRPVVRLLPSPTQLEMADMELLGRDEAAALARETVLFRATEYGNAQRLTALFGADIRYVAEEKTWHVWDGRRWSPDRRGELMRRAKSVARLLAFELPYVDDHKRREFGDHIRQSETKRGLQAMIALAASEKLTATDGSSCVVTALVSDFDVDSTLLNCGNGILNLRTGRLQPHDRKHMMRRIAPVEYSRGARYPDWDRFLRDATGHDQQLLDYLQLLAGATLLGSNDHDLLPILYGPPGSGKSTFIEALCGALGPDYADTASLDTFAERKASNAPREDIARLEGLRMVACVEAEHGTRLAVGLLKRLAGGDKIAARKLYEGTRTWRPEMTMWMAVNERPRVPHDEDGLFRRIKSIPFENQVPVVDPQLRGRLRDPLLAGPAVLAWAAAGARKLANRPGPLTDPDVVCESTNEYRHEQNGGLINGWLDSSCRLTTDDVCTSNEQLLASYHGWCTKNHITAISTKSWGTEMGRLFKRGRTAHGRFYRGVDFASQPLTDDR